MKKYNTGIAIGAIVLIGATGLVEAQNIAVTAPDTVLQVEGQEKRLPPPPRPFEEKESDEQGDDIESLRMEAKAKVESGELAPGDAYKQLRMRVQIERKQSAEEIKKVRQDFQSSLKEKKDTAEDLFAEKKEGLIQVTQDKRELFEQEFAARKDEMMAKREAQKAAFKEGMAKIKDEAKKAKAESIAASIPELNVKMTTGLSAKVTAIETVLVTIESRADKVATTDTNVSTVRTKITAAEAAIAAARAAIAAQVAKTYTVTIASDATAKSTLQATRDTFRADIKAVNVTIKAAHDATRAAAEALKAIPKVNDASVEASEATSTSVTTN